MDAADEAPATNATTTTELSTNKRLFDDSDDDEDEEELKDDDVVGSSAPVRKETTEDGVQDTPTLQCQSSRQKASSSSSVGITASSCRNDSFHYQITKFGGYSNRTF